MAAVTPFLLLGPAGALSQSSPAAPQEQTEAAPAAAPQPPMRVTTDTPEYCEALASQVEHAEHAPRVHPASAEHLQQVQELASEGHHMCADGLIRSGLTRLRRAWMLLRAEN